MTVNSAKQWPAISAVSVLDARATLPLEGYIFRAKRLAVSGWIKLTVLPESKRQSTGVPLIPIGAVDSASDVGLDWSRVAADEIPGVGAPQDGGALG